MPERQVHALFQFFKFIRKFSGVNYETRNRAQSHSFNGFTNSSNEIQENTVILPLEFHFYDAWL